MQALSTCLHVTRYTLCLSLQVQKNTVRFRETKIKTSPTSFGLNNLQKNKTKNNDSSRYVQLETYAIDKKASTSPGNVLF